jgi:hypothetical protein
VSNTATTAIMLPIGQGMLASLGLARRVGPQPVFDRVHAHVSVGLVSRRWPTDRLPAKPHCYWDA